MEYTTRQIGDTKYIDCSENCRIDDEQAALELVGICGEEGTDRVMLHSANMSADFFMLNTGLAGKILLKFVNYSIRVAAVFTPEQVNRGKFYEFALETNRGNQFRIFYTGHEAEDWLTRE